ncbi:hypothetical protein COLO4_12273 [Corchorus olitorius]|uniref:Uncharacterized protein n=1 Tax=Corchorus olitorius TaxID=93759 RepID=A0A1R3K1D9_9ROSI|nr:hypothetical protein COLO4_12273 [Corchorus olitorius]
MQSLVDKTVVTSPYGEIEAEFCYEDMTDFCFTYDMFDHVSENDCLLAVEMRRSQGFVTKKFSAKLKAGSPRPKSGRFDDGDGSFCSASVSKRQSPLSGPVGTRGGGSTQLSYSASNSRRHFRQHVDSMVLRGRQVARAIVADDSSCEVLSCNPRRVVPSVTGGGVSIGGDPRVAGRPGEVVARSGKEGSRFREEVRELYGDLGISISMGAVNPTVAARESVYAAKGKAKQLQAENQGPSSTDSTASIAFGIRLEQQLNYRGEDLRGQQISNSISSPSIPGSSRPNVGSLRAGSGPDLMGLVSGIATGSTKQTTPSRPIGQEVTLGSGIAAKRTREVESAIEDSGALSFFSGEAGAG